MSRWALLLLISYLAIGMSRMGAAKATRLTVLLTVMVVGVVMVRTGSHA